MPVLTRDLVSHSHQRRQRIMQALLHAVSIHPLFTCIVHVSIIISVTVKDATLPVEPLSVKNDAYLIRKDSSTYYMAALGVIILFCSGVAITVMAFHNPSYTKEIRVVEGDTVILAKIQSSDYSEVTMEERVEKEDSDHLINAYCVPCSSLIKRYISFSFKSRNLTLTSPTHQFGEQPGNTPMYLLAGSNISYRFRIWSSIPQLKLPQFVIFDDYNYYQEFINGDNDETKAIFRQELSAHSQDSKITEVVFSAPNEGYYFLTGYAGAGLSYQFNVTDNVYYLNETDYSSKYVGCHFHSGITCSFETSDSILGSQTEMCLIAHVIQPLSEDPPSTHIVINIRKRYALLIFPVTIASVSLSIMALLVVVLQVRTVYVTLQQHLFI